MNQIKFIPLKYIEDERGSVLHFLNKADNFFESFGDSYFSWINPGFIKGWYRHKDNISFITSPTFNLQVVLFDDKVINNFSIINITKENYGLIKIPVGIWYAFRSINAQPALVANILNNLYNSKEIQRLPLDTKKISFDWNENA